MTRSGAHIYPLIPAIYRQRDAALGRPLEALCKVLDVEYQALREDVASLYDQWFIETCSQWVVPYIGVLVGTTGIDTTVSNVATQRTRVANTLGYRSRRGTASVLANASADASGWPALPVEYFQRVITSVNVGAVELSGSSADNLRDATIDVSNPASFAYLDGPFSSVPRTVSVAAIDQPKVHVSASTPEYYNLPHLGLFLWRVSPLPLTGADPGFGPDGAYRTFHPLGVDTPLLRFPDDRTSPWTAPSPLEMPLSITRLSLAAWTDMWRSAASSDPDVPAGLAPTLGFAILIDGEPIPPAAIYVPTGTGHVTADVYTELGKPLPPGVYAVVDPERGRFMIHGLTSEGAAITVDWTWGQPGWVGGGPYDRTASMIRREEGMFVVLVSRTHRRSARGPKIYRDLEEAYGALREAFAISTDLGKQFNVLIRMLDSATYPPATFHLPDQAHLAIQALSGERPTVRAGTDGTSLRIETSGRARVVLSGLLLEPTVDLEGELDIEMLDTTVMPAGAEPAVRCQSRSGEPTLRLVRCIVGPLVLEPGLRADLVETIVDGRGGRAIKGPAEQLGPVLELAAVSVLGDVVAMSLDWAEDAIVTGGVVALRVSSEVLQTAPFALTLVTDPPSSPGKVAPVWTRPSSLPASPFVSTRYGDPGYCQLRLDAGEQLLRGGTGGGELGAYHSLASGQRLANLEPVLTEYTPFGFSVGIFIVGQATNPGQHERPSRSRGEAARR
ncbi:hypothetical protein WMF04_23890 [Sorangium sp. So ce260]|uniref:hypothetical protein n=1 Tax=Sorangium sp. So ce260 TaxID=3133291 RepID=UPI003F60E73B